MDKAAEAFRTISEVALELDVPKHVLRFWEGKFPQIKPMKRGGGRRYYRPEDVELLKGIRRLLYDEGYTIKGVQKVIRDHGLDFVKTTGADAEPAFVSATTDSPIAASRSDPNPVPERRQVRAKSTLGTPTEPESKLDGIDSPAPARRSKQTVPVQPGAKAKPHGVKATTRPPEPLAQENQQSPVKRVRGSASTPLMTAAVPVPSPSLTPVQVKRLRQARRELEICLHLLASDTDEEDIDSRLD
jgi:DNA-binding transcriptional MerR regulator